MLSWWMERLVRVDLRRASLRDHILPALERAPGRRQRIEVIKALYGWLRKVEHVMGAAEDPTLDTLTVPQARPAQWDRSKVIPKEHYLLVRERLTGPWPDLLAVLAGTGWHLTELNTFAEGGNIEPLPRSMQDPHGAAGVLVTPRHKSGKVHRTAVSAEVLEAARRVRERGTFSPIWFYKAVWSACAAAGIPKFNPGAFRHSVATWALDNGAAPESVAAFLGHESMRTTRRFYAVHATVPKVPSLA